MHSTRSQISCIGYTHVAKPDSWYDLWLFHSFNAHIWTGCRFFFYILISGWSSVGGIPAPVYFGALIDSACLKWSIKKCGGLGACRIYESNKYRCTYMFTTSKDYFPFAGSCQSYVLLFFFPFQNHFPQSDHLSQRMLLYLPHRRHCCPATTGCEARGSGSACKCCKGDGAPFPSRPFQQSSEWGGGAGGRAGGRQITDLNNRFVIETFSRFIYLNGHILAVLKKRLYEGNFTVRGIFLISWCLARSQEFIGKFLWPALYVCVCVCE